MNSRIAGQIRPGGHGQSVHADRVAVQSGRAGARRPARLSRSSRRLRHLSHVDHDSNHMRCARIFAHTTDRYFVL